MDADTSNEHQSLSFSNDSLFIENGNYVDLGGLRDSDWTETGNYTYNVSDNIGIGSTSPSEKLEVSGNIKLSGRIIQESWIVPSLLNSWVNFNSGFEASVYYKDKEGVIHLKGVVKSGTSRTILILPTGYRPINTRIMTVPSAYSTGLVVGFIDIKNNGEIKYTPNSTIPLWISLNGIPFRP